MNLFTKQKRVTDVGNHLRVIEWKYLSHVQLFGTPWTIQFMGFSRPETGVGSHLLLQAIFPTQGSVPGLQHCRWILYQMSHKEPQEYWSWQPIPAPGDISNTGIEMGSPALQVDSLPTELSGKPIYWGEGWIGNFNWQIHNTIYNIDN